MQVYVSGDAAAHLPKPSEAEQQAVELCGEEVRGKCALALSRLQHCQWHPVRSH